ncbi:MAG: orotidine-5'-phosphate decarboxylase [Proteobacteria bacterium]|nr:orotidine-5'-phosphate decarboxylase [Pseudomonadota bacterium]
MSELVVALDYPDARSALDMARTLRGTAAWMKVGLELYCAEGPGMVRQLKDLGFSVFLDLKFFDIPNTVRGAVRSAVRAGADMVNVHTLGGRRMVEAAIEGRDEAKGSGAKPLLLGVTILTSMDHEDLGLIGGAGEGGIGNVVIDLAQRAKAYYLDGVVCSGLEVAGIKQACGSAFLCLTPGIRPGGESGDDQRRVVTPGQAVADGSNFLVVGRPITQAADPAGAALQVLEQMTRGA